MLGFRRRRHLERTFSELVQEYGPSLHTFACKITGNEQAAEIIIQEVFLRLWQTRAGWSLAGNMEAWLYRLTEKRVIIYLHKKAAYKKQRRPLRIESIDSGTLNTEETEPAFFTQGGSFPENDASLQELLGETYASIRHHSATHVTVDGRLVQAIQPGILPHFLPRRRLRRDLRVAALATATALMLGFAAWVAWENQNAPSVPEIHEVYVPGK